MQNSRLETRSSFWGGLAGLVEGPIAWLVTLVLIPILVVTVLLLPPINLLDRLQALTYTRISPAGGMVIDPDGTVANFPAEGVSSTFLASIDSVPRSEFIEGQAGRDLYEAAANLPDYLIPKSPLYQLDVRGTDPNLTILTIPIPNDSLPYETLGVYSWVDDQWVHVHNTVFAGDDVIESRLDTTPTSFMVMQTVPGLATATADLGLTAQLPQGAAVTNEAKAGLYLRGDGALDGIAPVNNGYTLPVIRNWTDGTVRTDLINNLLADPGQQENQLVAVEQTIIQNGYPGVIIDYRGVDAVPSAQADYVRLIERLADRLHAAGKTIAVRVEAPRQISADSWDTLGYDWAALSESVDTLIVPAPVDPRAYQVGGETEALLEWATSQVERRKLQLELPGQSVERAGNYLLMKGYQESLQPLLTEIKTESPDGSQEVVVTLDNPRLLQRVSWDESTGMYSYSYVDDQGFERTVYIENAASIAYKLNMMDAYNARDVALVVNPSGDTDPNIWNILYQFQNNGELTTTTNRMSVSYTVSDGNGNIVAQDTRPLDEPAMAFLPAEVSTDLKVEAQILGANGQPVTVSSVHDLQCPAVRCAGNGRFR